MPAPWPAPCPDPSDPSVSPEGLMGGLLALLTHYARHPDLTAADRIARNFGLLARHPAVDAPLRTLCTRLFLDWLGPLDAQDQPEGERWITVHDAPPQVQ